MRNMTTSPDFEIGISVAGAFFKQKDDALKMSSCPAAWFRGQSYRKLRNYLGPNKRSATRKMQLRFHDDSAGSVQSFTLAQHIYQFQDNLLVLYGRRRPAASGRTSRPGFGLNSFQPTDDAKSVARSSTT